MLLVPNEGGEMGESDGRRLGDLASRLGGEESEMSPRLETRVFR